MLQTATYAAWWKPGGQSNISYPRTAVTERGSVTPSEFATWELKMNELECTLKDERVRRQRCVAVRVLPTAAYCLFSSISVSKTR